MRKSYNTTFSYKGKEIPLYISPHFPYLGKCSKFCFRVLINKYNVGEIVKGDDGLWRNLDAQAKSENLPFELTKKHYQRLGELIEEHLKEYV